MAPNNPRKFLHDQLKTLDPPPKVDLTGRVGIVTGGNGGLGYEAARMLAEMKPAKLIITSRSQARGQEAADKIAAITGVKVDAWELDQSSLKKTKEFGERCLRELDRLDILLLNAGVHQNVKAMTDDGFEMSVQVNNISTTLLGHMLLPLLTKTATLPIPPGSTAPDFKPHMTIVSSDLHYRVPKLPTPAGDRGILGAMGDEFGGMKTYNETKAINILNAETLASLAGPSIVINCPAPGWCVTNLGLDTRGFLANVMYRGAQKLIARTAEQGAGVIVWACLKDTPPAAFVATNEVRDASDFVISPEGHAARDKIFEEMKQIWQEKVGYVA
ncbi:hypothetical protein HDV00_007876 [Rhizophlyctis rosea]|nr:hypothetical protein HDV00_007876 [Rhizophlyctis rosea]